MDVHGAYIVVSLSVRNTVIKCLAVLRMNCDDWIVDKTGQFQIHHLHNMFNVDVLQKANSTALLLAFV